MALLFYMVTSDMQPCEDDNVWKMVIIMSKYDFGILPDFQWYFRIAFVDNSVQTA